MQSIIHLSPVLTEILEQGIEEGYFRLHIHKKRLNYYYLQRKSYLMRVIPMEAGRNDEESESLY